MTKKLSIKIFFSSLLLFSLLLSPFFSFAQGGTTGPLTWQLQGNTLTISGNGAMPDYSTSGSPWYSYRLSIHTVIMEDGITVIGINAFRQHNNLASVTIPNSVTTIGDQAFWNCIGLTSVTIPNSVTTIGNSAFDGCTGLTSVTIPNSVTTIGNYAFYDVLLITVIVMHLDGAILPIL